MIRNLRQDIEGAGFKPWEMPVNQMEGPHLEWLEMAELNAFQHCEGLRQLSVAIASDPQGARSGDRQHAARNERRADAAALSAGKSCARPKTSRTTPTRIPSPASKEVSLRVFLTPIRSGCDRRCWLRSATRSVPRTSVSPYLCVNDYAPHGRSEPGVWALPDGAGTVPLSNPPHDHDRHDSGGDPPARAQAG